MSNLTQLSLNLIKLSVHHSILAFNELLAVEDDDTTSPPAYGSASSLSLSSPSVAPITRSPSMDNLNLNPKSWYNLRVLDCSHNYVPRIDSSVVSYLLPPSLFPKKDIDLRRHN